MALGSKLRQAREALGLSQSELAERTHILVQIVRELEEEDYSRFSAAIYGKGFVKLYAKAVGLDPAPLVAEFLADYGDGETPKKKERPAPASVELEAEPEVAPPTAVQTPAALEPAAQVPAPQADDLFAQAAEDEVVEEASAAPPTVQVSQTVAPPLPPTLKASSVTMPSATAPKSAPAPGTGRPAAMRPTPAAVVPAERQETAREEVEMERPRSTAEDVLNRDNIFRLEPEQATPAIPPRPVVKNLEPFRYPKPVASQPQEQPRTAPAANAGYNRDEDVSELFDRPARKPARRGRKPSPKKEGPTAADYFRHFKLALATSFAAASERVSEFFKGHDDEDSRAKRHYYISGAAVVALVAVIIVVAAMSHRRAKTDADTGKMAAVPVVEHIEPVDGGAEYVAVDESAANAEEYADASAVALSAEIVKVLPAPKVFAR